MLDAEGERAERCEPSRAAPCGFARARAEGAVWRLCGVWVCAHYAQARIDSVLGMVRLEAGDLAAGGRLRGNEGRGIKGEM